MSEGQTQRFPFQVEVSRIIEVLAKQIYQSPLALLRENAQNAFDAILLRRARGDDFQAQIRVDIMPDEVRIVDNGIGMTAADLREHYWKAGSSSKNTHEAKAAGVVGTFGIGAMANFGVADTLFVETESAITGERTRTSANRDSLSTTKDTIELTTLQPRNDPGTAITARVASGERISVPEAVQYISEFVAFVDIPVIINGKSVSGRSIEDAVSQVSNVGSDHERLKLSDEIVADFSFRVAGTGETWVRLKNLVFQGRPLSGQLSLRQGIGPLRTFRSGFGLATVGAASAYGFGGIADIGELQPTAGREALTTESIQLLQYLITAVDRVVSEELAKRPESDANTNFMQWVRQHGRFDLCGLLQVRTEPHSERITLEKLCHLSKHKPVLLYAGSDPTLIKAMASDDSRLVVLAANQPRRGCEEEYLGRYCLVERVQDKPTVLSERPKSEWSLAEQALVFRVLAILESDYFLPAEATLGKLSHGLPLLAEKANDSVLLVFDPDGPTFGIMRELYENDLSTFGSMAKDFVRNFIFPRVADFVPSSTRQGAEAFLKSIRKTRDVFEYESADMDSLSSIWQDYLAGKISMTEAANRSTHFVQKNYQEVGRDATRSVRDVIPDVVDDEAVIVPPALDSGPAPPILRTDISSEAKLLIVDDNDPAVQGYRHFIALSDRAREERGEFFLQPHSTSVVWGGQKVLFVFEHHSGQFGLYYDIQTLQPVTAESGGGPFPTATIVLRDRIYIPIPKVISSAFVPKSDERKRFEIRCDLIYTETN